MATGAISPSRPARRENAPARLDQHMRFGPAQGQTSQTSTQKQGMPIFKSSPTLQASPSGSSSASTSTSAHAGEPARRGRGGVPRRRRVEGGLNESDRPQRAYITPALAQGLPSSRPASGPVRPSRQASVSTQHRRAPSPAPAAVTHASPPTRSPTPLTPTRPWMSGTRSRMSTLDRFKVFGRSAETSRETKGTKTTSTTSTQRGGNPLAGPLQNAEKERTSKNEASCLPDSRVIDEQTGRSASQGVSLMNEERTPRTAATTNTGPPATTTSLAEMPGVTPEGSTIDEPEPLAPLPIAPLLVREDVIESESGKTTAVCSEKPESVSSFLARRMQNLMSGLSFTAGNSSASSIGSDTSETQLEVPSTALTTAPSPFSRTPSKASQSPAELAAPPSASTSLAKSSEVGSPPIQQQKEAVQSAARLAALLASSREMNNNLAGGKESAWGILDRLKQPFMKGKAKAPPAPASKIDSSIESTSITDTNANMKTNASASAEAAFARPRVRREPEGARDVMLYAPLIPDSASTVELASSEVVTLYDEENEQERTYRSELRRRWAEGRGFISRDAMRRGLEGVDEGGEGGEDGDEDGSDTASEGTVKEESGRQQEPAANHETERGEVLSGEADGNRQENERLGAREKVIWMPSPTQISIQVLWWGYRIYLPPPVLEVLNNTTIEAAKRAALLTTALRWLLDNLPTTVLPLELRPVVMLLQYLVPALGAIGTFISWSWRAIGTFDKGYGVVLSATWLLPVVLVPGTWETNEIPCAEPSPASSQVIARGSERPSA